MDARTSKKTESEHTGKLAKSNASTFKKSEKSEVNDDNTERQPLEKSRLVNKRYEPTDQSSE